MKEKLKNYYIVITLCHLLSIITIYIASLYKIKYLDIGSIIFSIVIAILLMKTGKIEKKKWSEDEGVASKKYYLHFFGLYMFPLSFNLYLYQSFFSDKKRSFDEITKNCWRLVPISVVIAALISPLILPSKLEPMRKHFNLETPHYILPLSAIELISSVSLRTILGSGKDALDTFHFKEQLDKKISCEELANENTKAIYKIDPIPFTISDYSTFSILFTAAMAVKVYKCKTKDKVNSKEIVLGNSVNVLTEMSLFSLNLMEEAKNTHTYYPIIGVVQNIESVLLYWVYKSINEKFRESLFDKIIPLNKMFLDKYPQNERAKRNFDELKRLQSNL